MWYILEVIEQLQLDNMPKNTVTNQNTPIKKPLKTIPVQLSNGKKCQTFSGKY